MDTPAELLVIKKVGSFVVPATLKNMYPGKDKDTEIQKCISFVGKLVLLPLKHYQKGGKSSKNSKHKQDRQMVESGDDTISESDDDKKKGDAAELSKVVKNHLEKVNKEKNINKDVTS